MYIIKDLNKLYQDVKNYIKGESLIQTDYLFKINYNNLEKECLFKINYSELEVLVGLDIFKISFNDLEKLSLDISTSLIYTFILECFNIKEHIPSLYLEESYSNKSISISLKDNKEVSLLYFIEDTNISLRTGKPFFIIKKETILNNITGIGVSAFDEKSFFLYIDNNYFSYSMKLIDNSKIEELQKLVEHFHK